MARIFLTTIPKSGTHLLVNFFNKYGMVRHHIDDKYYQALSVIDSTYRIDDVFIDNYGKSISIFKELGIGNTKQYLQYLEYYRNKMISEIIDAPDNTYMYNHFPYDSRLIDSLVRNKIPIVCLVRDPRDNLISLNNHILRHSEHKHHQFFIFMTSDEERLATLIRGVMDDDEIYNVTPLELNYRRFSGWLNNSHVFLMRFEEIIGPKGNGSRFLQYKAFENMIFHIGLEPDQSKFYRCVSEAFSSQHSMFFKGQIGQWKTEFTPKVQQCFEQIDKNLLIEFGYSDTGYQPAINIDLNDRNDIERMRQCYEDAEIENSTMRVLITQLKQEKEKLFTRYKEIDEDSKKRLKLIYKLTNERQQWMDHYYHIKEDSEKRLALINKLTQKLDILEKNCDG